MSFTAALLAKALIGFALLALFLQCCGYCALGLKALAFALRGKNRGQKRPGVTLLLPLDGAAAPAALAASLQAGFAESYRPKEIIFCAYRQNEAGSAAIRAARGENAAQSSLLVSAPEAEDNAAEDNAAKARLASLVKGFKAARYDYVAAALPNAALPADYIACLLSAAGGKRGAAALVCPPLWAVRPRGLRARLGALFFNRGQMRLSLAACFGAGAANAAPSGAQAGLWNYEALHQAGGADIFAAAAAPHSAAAAATELLRRQNGAIRYAARALPLDFSVAAAGGEQNKVKPAADLRFCRRFLPKTFYAELLLAPFLPFLAVFAAWGLGGLSLAALIAFIFVCYAAEILFCVLWGAKAAGDKTAWKSYALLPARDILTPFFWLAAALRR